MRTVRLFVDTPLATDTEVVLPATAAEHAVRVLRLRAGDAVTLFNGDGHDYRAVLSEAHKRAVTATVQKIDAVASESPLPLTLAQSLARGEKMDLIVQKATELGVSRIVPLQTERCEVRLNASRAGKRLQHWRAVAASACEQSGRARLPEITGVQPLQSWVDTLSADGGRRLALTPGDGHRPRELGSLPEGAMLVVGPEGGLGPRDLEILRQGGFESLLLGPRTLRTESAGLAALAALQALYGDF